MNQVRPNLFNTGIRPTIDTHLATLAEEKRDYGDYWSASSAGYCMRKNIFERLKLPYTSDDARKQRVFSAGDVFHEWVQRITKESGLSVAQELELQDEDLMIRGHLDDLIFIDGKLIVYDYKSAHSRSFSYTKGRPMSHYHHMQLGTYLYILRKYFSQVLGEHSSLLGVELNEGRVMKISKDDLRMDETQLLWTPALEKEIVGYWTTLNGYWKSKKLPRCTCNKYEGGFMAREAYNPFWYNGSPCSLEWYNLNKKGK